MKPGAGRACHQAITVGEATAAAVGLALVVLVGVVAVVLVGGLPRLAVVCVLTAAVGGGARLGLEVPDLVKGVQEGHKRAHAWVDDHTTSQEVSTTREGRGDREKRDERSETDRKKLGGEEREPVTKLETGGRFPGLSRADSGNSGNGRHADGRYRATGTDRERFWGQVDTSDLDGCWPWSGPTNRDGYGLFKPQQSRSAVRAHRWAYEQLTGDTPALPLDHTCHTIDPTCPGGTACPHRRCVNPDHLEEVTAAENARRAAARRIQETDDDER